MRTLALAGLVAATVLTPTHFAPAPGWHTRVGKVHACPGVPASRCVQVFSVASTTSWRDCLACLPHRTIAAMGRDDIAIQIDLSRPAGQQPTFTWPPHIKRNQVVPGFEGLPSRISTYQGHTRIGKRSVDVFVVFGRPHPTDRQLQRADAELRHARFA
jgi:hypothetical protein